MIRFRQAALIASVFYFLGAVLEGSGPSGTLGRLGSVDALGGAFTVALAAALAILVIVRLGIPVSVSQTIVGALIGWNYFSGRLTNFGSLLTIASSWITAFVVAAGIAALLFYIVRGWVNNSKRHLLEQDMIIRYALIFFGAVGSYFLGANTIANAVGVFVPVTPFKDIALGPSLSINRRAAALHHRRTGSGFGHLHLFPPGDGHRGQRHRSAFARHGAGCPAHGDHRPLLFSSADCMTCLSRWGFRPFRWCRSLPPR